MKKQMKSVLQHIIAIILLIAGFTRISAQSNQVQSTFNTTDSLTLEVILKEVLANHPAVIKAIEATQLASYGVGMAKTAQLPDIDFGAGYTRMGPIPSITIPGMGTFEMAPADNFNAGVNVRQTVSDFSKTKKNIQLQESSQEIANANIDLVRQCLAVQAATNYYALTYVQETIKIKKRQIETLKEHLSFVNKKFESGSATKYEVLSTQVRLSAAETQQVDLETSYKNLITSLNSILGLASNSELRVKSIQISSIPSENQENKVDFAFNHRTEMKLADLKNQHAELNLAAVKVQNNPLISAFTSGGFKNGYIPELNKIKANYIAGVTLKVPIYSASRHKYSLMMASSDIHMAQQDRILAQRDILVEVLENDANLQAAARKITQSELQVQQAQEARSLAEVSYKTGSITNLDLLDTETLESESHLNLLKARTEYTLDLFRLKISMGLPAY